MAEAAQIGDLFITVTGNIHVIRGEHFAAMKDGAMICNSGHFNVELALDDLAKLATTINKGVREFVDEYVLADGRRVYVLGEGRLINLAAAHGHPASVMDMSFAAQALATEWSLKQKGKLEHKVYNVPKAVDQWVATLKLQTHGHRHRHPHRRAGQVPRELGNGHLSPDSYHRFMAARLSSPCRIGTKIVPHHLVEGRCDGTHERSCQARWVDFHRATAPVHRFRRL